VVELIPVTAPTPLLTVSDVAPLTDQESVAGDPAVMVDGAALKEAMVGRGAGAGAGGGVTVTVTWAADVPALFVALSVYVVVWAGETVVEVRPVTTPTLLLMLSEVAPLALQESVAGDPAVIVEGVAANEVILGSETAGGLTVTVTCALVVPALFAAVSV